MSFENDLGNINESFFFREFTYSSNKFNPDRKSEFELADSVVWLDEFLIVVQVKERFPSFGATAQDEENWFKGEPIGASQARAMEVGDLIFQDRRISTTLPLLRF